MRKIDMTLMTTSAEIQSACDAINEFGTDDHPHASPTTIAFFDADYLAECVTKAATHAKSPKTHLTVGALRKFLTDNEIPDSMPLILADLTTSKVGSLHSVCEQIDGDETTAIVLIRDI